MKRHLSVVAIAAIAGAVAAGAVQSLFSAWAVQNEIIPPTSGIYTGVQYSQLIGDGLRSVVSCNKGATAPANVGGSTVDGQCWIDDSSTPWIKKRYVNGGWAVEGALDPTDSSFAGVIGGGIGSIASGATVDLGSVPQANVTITGTTAITGFGSSAPAGVVKILRFDGALTLTHSSALTVPGSISVTTAANDRAIVTHLGSGTWEVTQFTRASGIPLDASAVGKIEYGQFEQVPELHVAGYGQALTRSSYPAYLAKVTRAQNGTRTSGNATIASVSNTAGFGAGMPVEGTGIGAGCTIASITASSITLNSGSCVTSSGTSTVTVFLTGYGSGGSSSTVGVPDCRGRTLAGRDHNLPGSLANRLTSSYFGADSSIYAASGSSGESVTMALGNLIAHTHNNTLNDPTHQHTGANIGAGQAVLGYTGGGVFTNYITASGSQSTPAAPTNISITNASAGSASPTPMRTVQPTLIAECVVRVTP
jgi:hypothetical protein